MDFSQKHLNFAKIVVLDIWQHPNIVPLVTNYLNNSFIDFIPSKDDFRITVRRLSDCSLKSVSKNYQRQDSNSTGQDGGHFHRGEYEYFNLKEVFQEKFKKQAEDITNLISGNFNLIMQENTWVEKLNQ